MKYLYFVFIVFIAFAPFTLAGQTLSKDRIQKIKSCTVKVTIDGTRDIGTGFYVSDNGCVATCWHVISPAYETYDGKDFLTRIYIVDKNGKKQEMRLFPRLSNEKISDAIAHDFCILVPVDRVPATPYMELGKLDDAEEGQQVYTCGYPLGIPQQFVSMGIISTKYIDSVNWTSGQTNKRIPRHQALLDLTMNPGNSGGAIVKLGNTIEEDKVIGIADFIINPIGDQAKQLEQSLASRTGLEIAGVNPNLMFADLVHLMSQTSNGVSGCVSIEYLVNCFKK